MSTPKDNELHFFVLDSRAQALYPSKNPVDLDKFEEVTEEDWDRFIVLITKSPKECERECNRGTYGRHCVIADETHIRYDWFDGKTWNAPTLKHYKPISDETNDDLDAASF